MKFKWKCSREATSKNKQQQRQQQGSYECTNRENGPAKILQYNIEYVKKKLQKKKTKKTAFMQCMQVLDNR